jgi:beta-1,4-mannosyl-glycoprotein beta-1,4-N-acetylglucosaminyltransferase
MNKKNNFFDCVTFFRENFITNIRFEILNDFVDYFVICESKYDHLGREKNFNFKLKNKKFKKKIIYIKMHDKLPSYFTPWQRQAYQRDFMLRNITIALPDDYIFFSDPDEIPNPAILKKFKLTKKYGIFLQKHYVYKFNIYNKYDTPWSGTRVCSYKNLKSIEYMRQKILIKNLHKWWRPDKEKSIQIINNGGWHFNNLFSPKEISIKLKTFAHQEFSNEKFCNISIIKKKIAKLQDVFNKGHKYKVISLNNTFPKFIQKNKKLLRFYLA